MDQEQEWLKEVQSGMEAKSLLDSPQLQRILRDLREQTISTWRSTKMNQTQERENAYHLMLATDCVENALNAAFDSGEVAKINLSKLKEERTHKKKTTPSCSR